MAGNCQLRRLHGGSTHRRHHQRPETEVRPLQDRPRGGGGEYGGHGADRQRNVMVRPSLRLGTLERGWTAAIFRADPQLADASGALAPTGPSFHRPRAGHRRLGPRSGRNGWPAVLGASMVGPGPAWPGFSRARLAVVAAARSAPHWGNRESCTGTLATLDTIAHRRVFLCWLRIRCQRHFHCGHPGKTAGLRGCGRLGMGHRRSGGDPFVLRVGPDRGSFWPDSCVVAWVRIAGDFHYHPRLHWLPAFSTCSVPSCTVALSSGSSA